MFGKKNQIHKVGTENWDFVRKVYIDNAWITCLVLAKLTSGAKSTSFHGIMYTVCVVNLISVMTFFSKDLIGVALSPFYSKISGFITSKISGSNALIPERFRNHRVLRLFTCPISFSPSFDNAIDPTTPDGTICDRTTLINWVLLLQDYL